MATAPRIEAKQMAGIHTPSYFAGQGIPYFKCSCPLREVLAVDHPALGSGKLLAFL